MVSLQAPQKKEPEFIFSTRGLKESLLRGVDVGDRVELRGTDVERGYIDFSRAGRRQWRMRFTYLRREIDPPFSLHCDFVDILV